MIDFYCRPSENLSEYFRRPLYWETMLQTHYRETLQNGGRVGFPSLKGNDLHKPLARQQNQFRTVCTVCGQLAIY
ncbi:hypothetical protein C7N83_08275 [Neisseria iguanae]|uniref:Uncharacterized protein n=1 Tax=Neisseria iguanae TaxID=90242 RepID=A0A2P7TZE8_9NEIS|nr:hypothetical protein C7N83_08275 [Neisseria iguanae]